jgi:RNA polymerase sigma factor (sigma-70 family)
VAPVFVSSTYPARYVGFMTDDRKDDLVERWRAGDEQAATELFFRYADRLIALVRSRLSSKLAKRFDPEDVIQSVYHSFFADARAGRYQIERGGDLWQLLVTVTLHKLQGQVQRHTAQKRGVKAEQHFGSEDSLLRIQAYVQGQEPSPVEVVALTDELEQVMRRLEPLQRRILVLRLQGYNLDEVAAQANCTERTVRRVLDRVKEHLKQLQVGEPNG